MDIIANAITNIGYNHWAVELESKIVDIIKTD